MKQQTIDRLMVAADNNAVLAAWASVIYQHGMPAYCDVAPHDHWDAYQDLFCRSVLSAREFDETDIKKMFFSGERPSEADVQHVLSKMCHTGTQEERNMSRAKAPTSAFNNAMVRTERGGLTNGNTLGSTKTRHAIESFRPERESLPPSKRPGILRAFDKKKSGLPCSDIDARMKLRSHEDMNGFMVCCGEQLDAEADGGNLLDIDEDSGDQFPMVAMRFNSTCPTCGLQYYVVAGEGIDRNSL